jgi:dienelactone hydrolase
MSEKTEKNTTLNEKSVSIVQHTLESTFANNPIPVEVHAIKANKRVVVNIHGAFGGMYGSGKYKSLASELTKRGTASVVLYQSARHSKQTHTEPFEGKTFQHEVEDAKKVVQYLLTNAQELFGTDSTELEVTINGNSLGGMIAVVIAPEFYQIKNLSTVGAGSFSTNNEGPLLGSKPEQKEIQDILKSYRGKLLVQVGTRDYVIPLAASKDFIQQRNVERAVLCSFKDVDHTFKKVRGEESSMPYQQVIRNIQSLIQDNLIVGGEVSFLEKINDKKNKKLYEEYRQQTRDRIIQKRLHKFFKDSSERDDSALENI